MHNDNNNIPLLFVFLIVILGSNIFRHCIHFEAFVALREARKELYAKALKEKQELNKKGILRPWDLLESIRLIGNWVVHERPPMTLAEFQKHMKTLKFSKEEEEALSTLLKETFGEKMTFKKDFFKKCREINK